MGRLATVVAFVFAAGTAGTLYYGEGAAVNFVVGYLCGTLVLAASAFGYWQMVGSADELKSAVMPQDPTERIDDPHGLWEEEESDAPQDPKTVLARERARLRAARPTLKERLRRAKPALSLYRLAAYALMAGSVIWLIDRGAFSPVVYLAAAGLPAFVSAGWLYLRR